MSNLLWRKIGTGTSAGRVQSVAVRLIVERERERIAFVDATYWDLEAVFQTGRQRSRCRRRCRRSRSQRFLPARTLIRRTGKLKKPELLQLNEAEAKELGEPAPVGRLQSHQRRSQAVYRATRPPFTTSTLQQEANRKLGFTAQRTMSAAQRLYENGYITYMRTDSTTLSKEAIGAARDLVRSEYGAELSSSRRSGLQGQGQERPGSSRGDSTRRHPVSLARNRSRRTRFRPVSTLRFDLEADRRLSNGRRRKATRQHHDRRRRRDLHRQRHQHRVRRLFCELTSRAAIIPEAELANKETILPQVKQDDPLSAKSLDPKSHTTQPPATIHRSNADTRRWKKRASADRVPTRRSSARSPTNGGTTFSRKGRRWCPRGVPSASRG